MWRGGKWAPFVIVPNADASGSISVLRRVPDVLCWCKMLPRHTWIFFASADLARTIARLQIRWIDLLRSVLYNETDPKDDSHCVQFRRLWHLIVAAADVREGYTEDSNALFCCIWRAVQNYWQKKVVDVKEGSVSSDHDDDDIELDAAEEAALAADETSLLRLGGFALHAVAKCMKQPELSVLW